MGNGFLGKPTSASRVCQCDSGRSRSESVTDWVSGNERKATGNDAPRYLLGRDRDRREHVPFRLCELGGGRGGERARDACEKSRELDYCTAAGSWPVRAVADCAQPIYRMRWTKTRAEPTPEHSQPIARLASVDTLLGIRISAPVEITSQAALSNVIDQRCELKLEQAPWSEGDFLRGLKLSPAEQPAESGQQGFL